MEHPNTTQSTRRPAVSPSEPERRHRGVQKLNDMMTGENTRHILYPEVIHTYLIENGLDTDEKGFIVRADSGEYVPPYEFDVEAYREADNPSDQPLSDFFVSKSEREYVPDDVRIHVTDMHGFAYIDNKAYPVASYLLNIERFRAETDSYFTVSTAWSSIHRTEEVDYDILTDVHVKKVKQDRRNRKPLCCYNCGFSGEVSEWLDGDEVETGEVKAQQELRERFREREKEKGNTEKSDESSSGDNEKSNTELLGDVDEHYEDSHVDFTGPVCPECHAKWDSNGVVRCESCGDEQWHAGLEHIPDMCFECKELGGLTLVTRTND